MDETKMTAAEMLAQVNTAMRDDLEAQLANEESGSLLGRTYVAFFDGR